MKTYSYIIFIIFCATTFADEMSKMYILHINGVQTTRDKAEDNRIKLMETAQVNSNIVEFGLVYNPTGDHSLLQDLDDVARQKAAENKDLTLDDYTQAWIKANDYPSDIYAPGTEEYENLKATVLPQYKELLGYQGANFESVVNNFHATVPPPHLEPVLNALNIVPQDYSKFMDYVLLVPHSQGNLYANSLYTYLTKTESFDMGRIASFGIATPASDNAGYWPHYGTVGNSYVTSTNDYVIKQASLLLGSVLQPNIDIATNLSDVLGHNLIDIYLSDEASIEKIRHSIHLALNAFAQSLYMPMSELIQISSVPDLPTYISYNNEIIFAEGKISENSKYKNNFHYYMLSYDEPRFPWYSSIVLFDALPGTYGIHVNADKNIVPYTPIATIYTEHVNIGNNIYTTNCYTDFNNSRICSPSKYNYASLSKTMSYVIEQYTAMDKLLIMEKMPEMYALPDLMIINELILN